MEPAVWIIIGIVGLVAVLIPIAIKQLKKADAQIADWVQENGWERVTDHQVEDTLARSWFNPANRQISRPWTMQVLRGQIGRASCRGKSVNQMTRDVQVANR